MDEAALAEAEADDTFTTYMNDSKTNKAVKKGLKVIPTPSIVVEKKTDKARTGRTTASQSTKDVKVTSSKTVKTTGKGTVPSPFLGSSREERKKAGKKEVVRAKGPVVVSQRPPTRGLFARKEDLGLGTDIARAISLSSDSSSVGERVR